MGFRALYYQDWVPNTARSKIVLTSARLSQGWEYLSQGVRWLYPLFIPFVPAIIGARSDKETQRRLILVSVVVLTWSAYLFLIGGCIFPARRHWVPLIAMLAIIMAQASKWAVKRSKSTAITSWIVVPILLIILASMTFNDPETTWATDYEHACDCESVGAFLNEQIRWYIETGEPMDKAKIH